MIDDIKKVRRKLGMNREEAKKKAEALVARMTLEEKASQLGTMHLQ
jgi:ABC-type histidine transport system ATPase subunit